MCQTTNRGVHQATHSYNQNDDGVTNGKSLQILAIEIHHVLAMLLFVKIKIYQTAATKNDITIVN